MRLALRCARLVGKLKRRLRPVPVGRARQGRAMILDRQTSRACAGRFTLLERDIERYLVRRVKGLGGVAYKFVSPSNRGVADRLVVLPQGVVWFVEVKKEGGRMSTLQELFKRDMLALGQNYMTLWDMDDVDTFIKGVK
jgi:hypothetical protein